MPGVGSRFSMPNTLLQILLQQSKDSSQLAVNVKVYFHCWYYHPQYPATMLRLKKKVLEYICDIFTKPMGCGDKLPPL